ncbi:MAG: ABC transporter permease [Anaerolinea sp.]|nr:ABC transporter permease [Anaerolinea sp.]
MAVVQEVTQQRSAGRSLRTWAQDVLLSQVGILFLILIVTIIVLANSNANFLTTQNLLNQGRLLAEVGLMALPMTFIIITGGIDLSVGSILGLSAILVGYVWNNLGLPLEVAIVVAILAACLAGFINGFIIVRVNVPPLIMTLATLAFFRGLAQGISEARSVTGYPEWFFGLGQGSILGVPTQLWILLIAIIVSAVLLARTTLGRTLYAIGNNKVGARFSGLPVERATLLIYTFSGLMAGISGVIFVSRFTTTRSDMGSGLELDAIAAVVLGGTSIFGGKGSIIGTVIGLVMIQLLKYGMAINGITNDATIVVIGSVLIFAILVNNLIQRLRKTE